MEEKARFRDLERAYSATHLARLSDNTVQSIETSSLHIDLISELKRINSLLCSIAYPIPGIGRSAGAQPPQTAVRTRLTLAMRLTGSGAEPAPITGPETHQSPAPPRA